MCPIIFFNFVLFSSIVLFNKVSCEHYTHHSGTENSDLFTNEWLVRIEGGQQVAELLALQLGYLYGGELLEFPGTYVFIRDDHSKHRRGDVHLTRSLTQNSRVQWAEQLFNKQRQKRDYIIFDENRSSSIDNNIFTKDIQLKKRQKDLLQRNDEESKPLSRWKRDDIKLPKKKDIIFNDELWTQEWYLQDTRTRDDLPKLDLNVLPVYKMGYTGKGVKVSILDDGIEYLHDDLKANYEPSISYDCNEKDEDPAPRYDAQRRNSHGTRCAGEVAMTANNGKCGVGIAYNAKIGGIKLLDGGVNDRVEGTALGFAYDKVDIYSASWGPNDDGKTVEGPGRLAEEALLRGVTKGRNGKGAIFVWASGNGGSRGDNCNCDGYIGSIYTVSIGSASQKGAFPWYGEPCAATLAVTYSSGAYEDQMIATTDLHNECTIKHTGTSASAPLAAGIIALALEANTNLTWRDVQHLIVWTSEYAPLADNLGWQTNGAGLRFDVRFGFGLMNAHALVIAAKNWTTVPEKSICEISSISTTNNTVIYNKVYSTTFLSTGCRGKENEINFLEHIELKTNIIYSVRGVLQVYLTSPKGTRVPLLSPRRLDLSKKGFLNWKFMSVATWGENPTGSWLLEVFDTIGPPENNGKVGPLKLILHGIKSKPSYMKNFPTQFSDDYITNKLSENSDSVGYLDIKIDKPLITEHELNTKTTSTKEKNFQNINEPKVTASDSVKIFGDKTDNSFIWKYLNDLFEVNKANYQNIDFQDTMFSEGMPDSMEDERLLNRVHHHNFRISDAQDNSQSRINKYLF